MTDLETRLKELEALCAAATPGPWIEAYQKEGEDIVGYDVFAGEDGDEVCSLSDVNLQNNQTFIAAARNELPELIAIIRKMKALISDCGFCTPSLDEIEGRE